MKTEKLNLTKLAEALKCSRMSLNRWRKEVGFPSGKNGYDLESVKQWIFDNEKMQGSGRRVESDDMQSLRKRLLEQEVEKNELELSKMRHELISLDEAKCLCVKIGAPISRRVKDLPASMCLKCNPSDPSFAKAALRAWADETLNMVQRQWNKIKP